MGFQQLVESQIAEAIAAGAFDGLPGAGQPLPSRDSERLAGNQWLGFKVLQNGGMLPEWLSLGRDIERDHERLQELDQQHAALCDAAVAARDFAAHASALCDMLSRYEACARELRKKQDRFNAHAPGWRSQRPCIWVEYHVDRLRARAGRAAEAGGGPVSGISATASDETLLS